MVLDNFLKKTLGLHLLDSSKTSTDPALKQGARFNKMQNEIITSILPDLPLMEQTTGPNLGSLQESLANMQTPPPTALDRLDKRQFRKFELLQDEFNTLLSQLTVKEAALRRAEMEPHNMENVQNASLVKYDVFNRSAPASHNYWTAQINKDRGAASRATDFADQLAGEGCSMPAATSATQRDNTEASIAAQVLAESTNLRQLWNCGVPPCPSVPYLRRQIKALNTKIMKLGNRLVAQTRALNRQNQDIDGVASAQQQKLHGHLGRLRNSKGQRNKLTRQQQTLMAEMADTRLDLDSKYYQYVVWLISAVTLGALVFHTLMKNK